MYWKVNTRHRNINQSFIHSINEPGTILCIGYSCSICQFNEYLRFSWININMHIRITTIWLYHAAPAAPLALVPLLLLVPQFEIHWWVTQQWGQSSFGMTWKCICFGLCASQAPLCFTGPCGLQGCKNRPAPFLGQMTYKATVSPGLVLFYILACFNCIVAY